MVMVVVAKHGLEYRRTGRRTQVVWASTGDGTSDHASRSSFERLSQLVQPSRGRQAVVISECQISAPGMPRTEVSRGGGTMVGARADELHAPFHCGVRCQCLRRYYAPIVDNYDLKITPRVLQLPHRTEA